MTSIYDSVEMNAWARDFRYADYLRLASEANLRPISIDHYDALCVIFDKMYEDDQK